MNKDTPITVCDGFTEKVGDWRLASALRDNGFGNVLEKECIQNCLSPRQKRLLPSDFRRVINAYSYGGASCWEEFKPTWQGAGGYVCDLFVGVLIVPDINAPCFQDYSVWHKPRRCRKAIVLHAETARPQSAPLKDVNNVWFDFDDPDLITKCTSSLYPSINIDCQRLVAGLDPISQHTTMMNRSDVLSFLVRLHDEYPDY